MKRILTAIIIIAALFVTACDDVSIALGSALNLKGPVVEILGPTSSESKDPTVGTLFNLYGTAISDSRVSRMSVTLTYFNRQVFPNRMVPMGREWKWEGGSWYTREGSSESWKTYNQKVYADDYIEYQDKITDPSWDVLEKTVSWNLPVYMLRMEKGQYFITVTAWDNTGNSDSNSSKRLKVEFSNEVPTLKVDTPTGNISTQLMESGEGSSLDAPKPPDFSGVAYTFDPFGNPQQTYENRFNFVNKFPDFRWTADHYATLSKLTLEITNEHNLDTAVGKKTYYKGVFTNVNFNNSSSTPKKSQGNLSINGIIDSYNGGSYYKIGNDIKFNQGEYSANYNELPDNKITPLQVLSTLEDGIGKKEYKSKGWLLWLPDSDKPFADITFGYKVRTNETPPADAAERMFIYRGSKNNRITFYDDKEGVAKATLKVTRLLGSSFATDSEWIETVTFNNNSTYLNYNFTADLKYGVGRYKIEVQATDAGTTEGYVYTAYFNIVANTSPEILNWDAEFAAPDSEILNTTLWGSPTKTNGDINFWGKAAIEGSANGIRVDRVTVVLLNYEDGDLQGSQNEIRFTDPTYSNWDRGTEAGYTDSNKNKIWEIPANKITFASPGSQGSNLGDNDRDEWRFEKTLNWFTDLNGLTSTKNKKLIVRALTHGAMSKDYYGIKTLTIHGDDHAPTVAVTKIRIESRPSSTGAWDTANGKDYPLPYTTGIIPAITPNHRIKLYGTWNDDSAQNWLTIPTKTVPKDLFKSISIRWEGNQKKYDLVTNVASSTFILTSPSGGNDGAWETDFFAGFPAEGNTDPLITLLATFTDLAGNANTGQQIITVETDTPTLSRISSDDANGRYSQYKPTNSGTGIIKIFLGFNKPIFTTGSTTNLYLQLNNGGRATYQSGLGTFNPDGSVNTPGSDKIIFTYDLGSANGGSETGNSRLQVTAIMLNGSTFTNTTNEWKSSTNSNAIIQNFVFNDANSSSFAGQKNIIIDKTPPAISSITTSASSKIYGKGQQLIFIVNFNEDIDLGASISSTTTYLNIAGTGFSKQAGYYAKSGASSVQFLYTVQDTDNATSDISVTGIGGFNNFIFDKAMNAAPSTAGTFSLAPKSIRIDTTAPAAPTISADVVTSSGTAYGPVIVTVGGIESGARWEHNTAYTNNITTGWITHPAENNTSNKTLNLSANGTYTIAARQYDGASPENGSPTSTPFTFTINSGAILTKITSSNPSGSYGYGVSGKGTLNIVLEFRIPVKFTGITANNVYITLNVTGGENRVFLPTSLNNTLSQKVSLTYTIPEGAYTSGNLNVTALDYINANGVDILDTNNKSVKTWSTLDLVTADNMLNRQKDITISTGRPTVAPNNNLGTAGNDNTGIWFNGTELGIKYDRDISRNSAITGKLIIRQILDNFRIPAVLTEQRFSDLFSGRVDMFTDNSDIAALSSILSGTDNTARAKSWENLGNWLYQKGSNGATLVANGNNPSLNPDTTTKYILRFSIDTTAADTTSITLDTGITNNNTITMANLANLFRAAEALTFGVNDPNIKIVNDPNAKLEDVEPKSGNILKVYLIGTRALPVRGASYEWVYPNGFVVDSLGRPSGTTALGTTPTGPDNNISSSGATRRLNYKNGLTNTNLNNIKVETPVIRIDKGGDETYFDNQRTDKTSTETTRQARQKLQAEVKMDCRTPSATTTYRKKEINDGVGRLIMRGNPGTRPNHLPNLGAANTFAAWEAVRLRPQSGGPKSDGSGNWTAATGLDLYTTTGDWINGGATDYPPTNPPLMIGSTNYSDGGQVIYFQARSRATDLTDSDYGFEAAYRSVFVYNHSEANTNNGGAASITTNVNNTANRIWIRGSNTAQGDPTIPNFPLARDPSLYRKVKLLTPIKLPNNYAAGTALTDNEIDGSATAASRDLWFWVTWQINVNTFVDLQTGYLDANSSTAVSKGIHAPVSNIGKFYMAYIPSNEHYAVIPGRTTVVETRTGIYNTQYDGSHGELDLTTTTTPPAATDIQ